MSDTIDPAPQAQALIPFTGFYTLDPTINSFVMVDTHEVWTASQTGGEPSIEYFGTVTLSPDGIGSGKFEIGAGASFDGTNLVVPQVGDGMWADLTFGTSPSGVTVSGVMSGVRVSGTTPFGPVKLALWTGTYYQQGPVQPQPGGGVIYPYTATLQINADGTMLYTTDGGTMVPVPSYWYDYGMFVIGLMDIGEPGNVPKLYEMGTSSGWGRVAGDATSGVMLLSLQLQEPAPHL